MVFIKRSHRRKIGRKTRKMTNEELRTALWETRDKLADQEVHSEEIEDLMVWEEMYSIELKNRELLEWALQTRK